MVAEIFGSISALKSAFDLAKGLKDIESAAGRNRVIVELTEKIFAAQTAQAALVHAVEDLKKQVARFEAWEAEKQRYQLDQVRSGAFVYSVKESMRGIEPPHKICATCFQHSRKSILQPLTVGGS